MSRVGVVLSGALVVWGSGCSLRLTESGSESRDGGGIDAQGVPDASSTDAPIFVSRWPDSPTELCSDGATFGCSVQTVPQDGSMVSPVPVYTIEAPLRTSDSVTQLLWDSSSIASDQVAAGTACGELGEGVWRLPTLIELASLVDYGKAPPYIDVLFGVEDTAWSSNPGVAFNFLTGSPTSSSGTEALKVLCVQGVGLTPSFSTNGAVEALSGLEFGVQNSLGAWIGQLQDCAGRAATAKELLLFASGGSALTMPPDGVWTSSPDSKSVSQALVFLPATSPPSIVSAAINTSFPIVCISSP